MSTRRPTTSSRARKPGAKGLRRPGKEGGVRDRNRKERVRALTETSLQLFVQRGIDAVTIDDITQLAGVAKGTFYSYFDSKEAVLEAIVAPVRGEVVVALADCSKALEVARDMHTLFDAYRALGAALGGVVLAHPGVVRLYLQENRGPPTGARAGIGELARLISKAAIDITHSAHRHRLLRPLRPQVTALGVVGAVERLLYAVLCDEDIGNPLEFPDVLASMVLDGLRARPAP